MKVRKETAPVLFMDLFIEKSDHFVPDRETNKESL